MDCAIRLGQLKNCQIMSANTCQKVGHRPSDHVHKRRKTTRPYVTEICETKTKTVVSVIYRGDNGNVMWTVLFILNHWWRLHVLKIVESQNMNLNVGTFCKCDSGDFFWRRCSFDFGLFALLKRKRTSGCFPETIGASVPSGVRPPRLDFQVGRQFCFRGCAATNVVGSPSCPGRCAHDTSSLTITHFFGFFRLCSFGHAGRNSPLMHVPLLNLKAFIGKNCESPVDRFPWDSLQS